MPKVDFREEVLNVALAELLEQRGMLSVPETIRKNITRTRDLPDILVGDLFGVRIVIEGRFDKGKSSRDSLLKDSKERVENGISPVCLAVLYPPELRSAESLSAANIQKGNWNEGAAFAQTELCRAAHYLWRGEIFRPGVGTIGKVHLTRLKAIADIGPDRRDIHDGFKPTDQETEYPAVWGHDTTSVQRIAQRPNKHLIALSHAKKGRNLRDAHLLWTRSGRLLVAERLWLITTRLVAIRASEKVLSNTWWPIAADAGMDKILALWFNSSLGLLSLLASRVDTRGAWIDLKKPILEELLVIDPRKLSKDAQQKLISAYDEVCKLEIQALPQMAEDGVREKIDAAIADALRIKDDLSMLRKLLAAEPIISMHLPG